MYRTAIGSSILIMLIGAAATPLLAAGEGVPVYPGTVNKTPSVPAGGPVSQLETADSVATVDAWYGERLPTSCVHQRAQGGAKYACPDKNIMIGAHDGKTLITYIASMGGMFGH